MAKPCVVCYESQNCNIIITTILLELLLSLLGCVACYPRRLSGFFIKIKFGQSSSKHKNYAMPYKKRGMKKDCEHTNWGCKKITCMLLPLLVVPVLAMCVCRFSILSLFTSKANGGLDFTQKSQQHNYNRCRHACPFNIKSKQCCGQI